MNSEKLHDTKLILRNLLNSCTVIMKEEKEIKEAIPFGITSKRVKYLGINQPEGGKALNSERYKILMREIKDVTDEDPCSKI